MRSILVIKLGALGDFIHALHGFAAIRAHHRGDPGRGREGDRVTLLTTAPFAALARRSPFFDAVEVDARSGWWNVASVARTVRVIRGADFVYDLQTSARTGRYFWLAGRPAWSGIAAGCSHPHANPERDRMHTVERQREQLEAAGITEFPLPERDWLIGEEERPALPCPFALLVPGGAGVGSVKRWPVERYAGLARVLVEWGVTPVVIGGGAERGLGRVIAAGCAGVVDLTGRTSIEGLAALGAEAALVVGNDTGPVHLVASMGAPTVMLFSAAGVPAQAAARGPAGEWATVIQADPLASLAVERVAAAALGMLKGAGVLHQG